MSLKLKPEVKAELVKRLRSGEYVQGQHFLRTSDDKMCCLGVLCEMAVEAGAIEPPTVTDYTKYDDSDTTTVYQYGADNSIAMPPTEVYHFAFGLDVGANSLLWEVGVPGSRDFLPALNDEGVPFPEIADYIERDL